eukprot:6067176-Pleurochrysis_carterae.AAC.1
MDAIASDPDSIFSIKSTSTDAVREYFDQADLCTLVSSPRSPPPSPPSPPPSSPPSPPSPSSPAPLPPPPPPVPPSSPSTACLLKTDIVLILDRTGSMAGIVQDVVAFALELINKFQLGEDFAKVHWHCTSLSRRVKFVHVGLVHFNEQAVITSYLTADLAALTQVCSTKLQVLTSSFWEDRCRRQLHEARDSFIWWCLRVQ